MVQLARRVSDAEHQARDSLCESEHTKYLVERNNPYAGSRSEPVGNRSRTTPSADVASKMATILNSAPPLPPKRDEGRKSYKLTF